MKFLPHAMKKNYFSNRRRHLVRLVIIISAAVNVLFQPAWAQSVPKNKVLGDIAAKIIAPGYTELDLKCRALTNAIGQLAAAPNEASLDGTRQAWSAVAVAANRTRYFQAGPIVEREYVATFFFWRVRGPT